MRIFVEMDGIGPVDPITPALRRDRRGQVGKWHTLRLAKRPQALEIAGIFLLEEHRDGRVDGGVVNHDRRAVVTRQSHEIFERGEVLFQWSAGDVAPGGWTDAQAEHA